MSVEIALKLVLGLTQTYNLCRPLDSINYVLVKMYDPIELADQTKKLVVDGDARKYYRLTRPGRWYGGIATFDGR